ncbi:MAG TPA: hypothetical protein VK797_06345 [Tepidisphaeraceae bacterium]|nr:hypothetical protein [Tepidisphaeraceae bacterium]
MQLSNDVFSRLARLMFSLLMALCWAGMCDVARARPLAAASDDAQLTPQQWQAQADALDKRLQELEALEREIPRETFDPGAIVAKVGSDPVKLCDWVRQETSPLPYRGVLRGPIGVLMDRLGNSLDRALLLARLLQATGSTVRLAHAQLAAEQAKRMLADQPKARPPAGAAGSRADAEAAAEQYAKAHAQDPRQAQLAVDSILMQIERMSETAAEGTAAQLPIVTGALGPAQPTGDDSRIEAVADHWWVQRKDGDKWSDLDSELPGGKTPAAQQTIEAQAGGGFALDPQLYHRVRLRVVVEQWKDGKLQEAPAFEQTLRPSAMLGQRIVLNQVPLDWPGDLNLLSDPDAAGKFRAAVLAQHEWVPVLSVGTQTIVQHGFTDSGEIDPKPSFDSLGKTGKSVVGSVSKVLDAFGGPGNDQPAAPPKPSGMLTAEWVEFVFESPGRPIRTVRRQMFDLIPPGARKSQAQVAEPVLSDRQRLDRAAAALGAIDVLPLGNQLSSEFVEEISLANLKENHQAILDVLRNGGTDQKKAMDSIAKLSAAPAPLYNWALARSAWSRHRDVIGIDQTNLVCLRRQLRMDPQEHALARVVLDVIANHIALRPGVQAEAFAVRIEQGIVDTNVEAVVLPVPSGAMNLPQICKRADAQRVKWITMKPGDRSKFSALNIPEEDRSRIGQELAGGYTVVAPERPLEVAGAAGFGWWQVDGQSGETLGMTEFGGATMTEYALMLVFGVTIGLWTYIGCGGIDPNSGHNKKLACAVCAAVTGALAAFGMGAALKIGGMVGTVGGILGAPGGIGGAGLLGIGCNAVSGMWPSGWG